MEIIIFMLIAAAWAAFLLPPVLRSRRDAPISSTQAFDRSLARLASVQGHVANGLVVNRHRILVRRRRALVGLGLAAVVTLVIALWRHSVNLLFLHLATDALAVGYVAMLLSIKQRRAERERADEQEGEDRAVDVLAAR